MIQGDPARAALLRGADRMLRLVRPTLGPLPRTVAVAPIVGSQPPEILDSGGVVARRTLELADPFDDMGFKLLRHLAWRVFDRVGDGSATAVVLAESLLRQTLDAVGVGADAVLVRRGLERGSRAVCAALRRQARPLDGPTDIVRVVRRSSIEIALAEELGEALDTVGADGAILIEDADTTDTTLSYTDGVRWNEGLLSPYLLRPNESTTARASDARVLLTDYTLERVDQLLPALEACVQAGERSLFVVAQDVRDQAVGLLVLNRERGLLDATVAVRAPSFGSQRVGILDDLAALTGGRAICQERHDRLDTIQLADLGRVRHAWATRSTFGLLGWRGSRDAIRRRVEEVRAQRRGTDEVYARDKIAERVGKLTGTAAVIRVGAPTSAARAERKQRLEATVRTGRAALREGVVAGGGAALAACLPELRALPATGDERIGLRALERALLEPTCAIAGNAGFEAGPIVAATGCAAGAAVFDVLEGAWVDPWAVGLLDPVAVVEAAVEASTSAVGAALLAEVLVHRRDTSVAIEP